MCDDATGAAIYLFFVDWSKPGRSFGSGDSSHVQDRQEQVRVDCSDLDPKVRHGLTTLILSLRKNLNNSTLLISLCNHLYRLVCLRKKKNVKTATLRNFMISIFIPFLGTYKSKSSICCLFIMWCTSVFYWAKYSFLFHNPYFPKWAFSFS